MTRMTRLIRVLASFGVVLGLAVPALAEAQAIPRPGTTGGSSGSSSGGSSGGSGTSGGGGGGGDVTPPPSSRGSSGSGSGSAGSASPKVGTFLGNPGAPSKGGSPRSTAARRAPEPGGLVGGHVTERTRGTSGVDSPRAGVGAPEPGFMRDRGTRPVTGTAAVRPASLEGGFVSFPLFGPWGRWYPWYSSGFGWNLGYVSYDPWRYGATCWVWGRYGMWYDPWGYRYNPYSSSYYWGQPSDYGAEPAPRKTTGSLRLRVNPADAEVYIDGVLVGVVDEFNGLRDHLEVEGGRRVLELRSEGFVTETQDIVVDAGKTKTVRISLKKTK